MPSLDTFYTVSFESSPPWWWLEQSDAHAPADPVVRRMMNRAEYTGDLPIPMRRCRGTRRGAMIGSDGSLTIISPDFHSLLQRHGCTGFVAHPLVVYDQMDREIVDRNCVWITVGVGAGKVDRGRGECLRAAGRYDPSYVGVFFDPSTWSGADVFVLADYKAIIWSQRLGRALLDANLPGVIVEPVTRSGQWLAQRFPLLKTRGSKA